METTNRPQTFDFALGHPSSPPMTPGPRIQARYPPQTSHTSPLYKRMGLGRLAQSPPLEFIEPIGQGPQFHFTRPQSRGAASLASTVSGRACATTHQASDDDEVFEEEHVYETVKRFRHAEETEISFVIEEWDSESGYDSDLEVVRPDHCEDAKSEKSRSSKVGENMLKKFKDLQCDDESSDEEERQRIYRRKKKRWSAGIFKRSHSQSVEGDSSYSDNDPLDDVDSTARRLRRRVRGPNRRESLIFVDHGFPNYHRLVEVEEPDEGVVFHQGPPSIPSDDAFTLDELPFWQLEETMQFQFDSS